MTARKRSKRNCPQGKLMMYVIMLTILVFFLYLVLKSMILKLANSVEEQNFEVNVENEDIGVDDIGAAMWI